MNKFLIFLCLCAAFAVPIELSFSQKFSPFSPLPLSFVTRREQVAGLMPLQDWSSFGGQCLQEKSHGNWWKEHVIKPLTKK